MTGRNGNVLPVSEDNRVLETRCAQAVYRGSSEKEGLPDLV